MSALADIAKFFKVNLVKIESNFGDGSFSELLKPYLRKTHNCSVEDVRATTQKEKRIIDTIEPIVNQHRLIVSKRALIKDADKNKGNDYKFTYQYTHITKDKGSLVHDDIIDVVEMGVVHWVETVARDESEEQKRYEEEQLDRELEEFLSDMCDVSTSNNVMDSW